MSRTILVSTVGGSSAPIIKSVQDSQPDVVYFIPSIDSETKLDEILREAYPDGNLPDIRRFSLTNPNDLVVAFQTCVEAFGSVKERAEDGDTIIADPTGGTKIMSAALVLAASELGVRVDYVSGDRTKDGLGVVKNGSEYFVHTSHPYDLIARSQKVRFCEFFNTYRFSSAIDICSDVVLRSSGELRELFKCLRMICDAYRHWDLFKFKSCGHELGSAHRNLTKFISGSPESTEPLRALADQVQRNLEHVREQPDERYSLEMADELVSNARRRASEGKFDDAVARLYRALEMIAQVRFVETYGTSTTKFPIKELSDKARAEFFSGCEMTDTQDIGCMLAYKILHSAGDEYGNRFIEKEREIRSILHLRNESILAHGNRPMRESDFEKLYEIFRDSFGIEGIVEFPRIELDDILHIGLPRQT